MSNFRGRLESQLICDSEDDSDVEGGGGDKDNEEVCASMKKQQENCEVEVCILLLL